MGTGEKKPISAGTNYGLGTMQNSLVDMSALFNPQEELCEGGAVDFYPYFGNEDSEAQRS